MTNLNLNTKVNVQYNTKVLPKEIEEDVEVIPCSLQEAQGVMIDILKEVHRICEKHDIKYFISDGSLLGAIRHKGFIPWDDDLDISMIREDYNKFMEVAPKELSEEFFMQTFDTDPKYNLYHIPLKVRHNNSVLIEIDEDKSGYHNGIYIDIFPFDKVPDSKWKHKLQSTLSRVLLISKMKITFSDGVNLKSIFRAILQFIFKAVRYKTIKKILFSTIKWSENSNSHRYYHGVDLLWDYEYTEEELFPLKEVDFEGEKFWAPNKPHEILTKLYGDYMQLPPEDKRQYHAQFIGLKKKRT